MKFLYCCLTFPALFFYSCGSVTERQKTPEELKMELLLQENNSPLTYLEADATMHEDQVQTRRAGLFHDAEYSPDGNTITVTIKSTATIAKFKDVILAVTYYSQTDTPIETQNFTVYEFFKPNSSIRTQLKVYPPQAMKKFGIEIKGATPVN
jgi:hypothetical protein